MPRVVQVEADMSIGSDGVLEGAPVGPVPSCSLAEYLLRKIRSLPRKHVIQVDGDSGAGQTVEELLETSVRLSEGMRKLGLREDDVVALTCRNCFDSSAVVLATWLSGAVIAPIAHVKVAEMKYVLELIKPKLYFCEERVVSTVSSTAKLLPTPFTIILVDTPERASHPHMTFQDVLADADVDSYQPHPVPSPATQLTAILFSSGTSGLPKGVEITHTNLIVQDFNMQSAVDPTEMTNCMQISNFYWVTGVLMFFRTLTTGISRVLLRETTPANVLRAIERYKTDWTLVSPLFLLSLVESPEFESRDVSSMRRVLVGGSTVRKAMVDRIKAKWKSIRVVVAYGTTEVSGIIALTGVEDDLSSVGRVSEGVKVKIVDTETGKALKADSLGEICVKSPGIMRGYVGNEEATREVVDPEGWCHTGDLGYYDESGQIFIVDRMKEMIKVNDMQVAPTELENVILALPGVSEVAVVGVTEDGLRYQIVALVVRAGNSTLTAEDVSAQVANTLSDYKRLTGGVRFVESLPKTVSGKLDRKKIRTMAQTPPSA